MPEIPSSFQLTMGAYPEISVKKPLRQGHLVKNGSLLTNMFKAEWLNQ